MNDSVYIQQIADADLDTAQRIYLDAFPPEERRPWESITDRDKNRLRLEGIYRNDLIAGIITTWKFDLFTYVEHLAIDRSFRGHNIGGSAIATLARRENRPLLIEVEPSGTTPDADRRIRFYHRHGFEIIDTSYIQPPYGKGLPSVPLWLMSTGLVDPSSAADILHAEVYTDL